MKRIIAIILVGVCVIGIGVLGFFLYTSHISQNKLNEEFDNYKQGALSTQSSLTTLLTQSSNQSATNAVQLATSVSLLADETTKYDAVYADDQRLAKLTKCLQISFKPDYSSNSAMSSALKIYAGDTIGGNITSASWDIIWTDSRDAIHNIIVHTSTGNIKASYIVYLDDFSSRGVFDVNRQCWLSSEEK
jgi:hypothetical protein